MKRVLLGALLGAIVVFVWQFVSWTVLPWHNMTIDTLPGGEVIATGMKAAGLEAGIYHFPGEEMAEGNMEAWMERYRSGPNINFLVFSPTGADPMDPAQFAGGFLLNFLSCLVLALMLVRALPGLGTAYLQRVRFVVFGGLLVVLAGILPNWNWWHFPTDYILVESADAVLTWLLAGFAIAWQVKPAA